MVGTAVLNAFEAKVRTFAKASKGQLCEKVLISMEAKAAVMTKIYDDSEELKNVKKLLDRIGEVQIQRQLAYMPFDAAAKNLYAAFKVGKPHAYRASVLEKSCS